MFFRMSRDLMSNYAQIMDFTSATVCDFLVLVAICMR